jgi:hypothetical protein
MRKLHLRWDLLAISICAPLLLLYVIAPYLKEPAPYICFHRSNTQMVAEYGVKHAGCLETDLTITDGKLTLYHPPAPPTGYMLQDIVTLVNNHKLALWIDAKNIDNPQNCRILEQYLATRPLPAGRVLVEYPPSSDPAHPTMIACATPMSKLGYIPAFYMPIQQSHACAFDIHQSPDGKNGKNCQVIRKLLRNVHKSKIFTHITFPYYSLIAYETLEEAQNLTWNIWDVPASKVQSINPERFYMIILQRNMAQYPGE